MLLLKKLTRLLSNDGKTIKSIGSTETSVYQMSKDLVSEKDETIRNWLTLMKLQRKT